MLSKKLTKQLKELGLYNDFVKAASGDEFAVHKLKLVAEKNFTARVLLKNATSQLKAIRLKLARGERIGKPQQHQKLIAEPPNGTKKKGNVILRNKDRARLISKMKRLGIYELWRKSLRGDIEAGSQLKTIMDSNPEVKKIMSNFQRTGFTGTGGAGGKSKRYSMRDHAAKTKGWVSIYRG